MKSLKNICTLLLLSALAYATEYVPWFSPPLEFHGYLGYLYTHSNTVQSPQGSFHEATRNSCAHLSVAVTPWPHWNLETELFLTRTTDITFTYESAFVTLRYAWLDDVAGDWLTLTTGATLSLPASRFLHEFSFAYHGHTNVELHATLGKEWTCNAEWTTRIWALAGCGIADQGSAWVHGLGCFEYHISPLICALFSEAVYGLGSHNIIPLIPFEGYASIGHQMIDIGAYLTYELRYFGTLTLLGWYQLHARNFIDHSWGTSLSLQFPFSVL